MKIVYKPNLSDLRIRTRQDSMSFEFTGKNGDIYVLHLAEEIVGLIGEHVFRYRIMKAFNSLEEEPCSMANLARDQLF